MTDRLSREMFHPDCRFCGADGPLYVDSSSSFQSDSEFSWECNKCGGTFTVEQSSPWFGVWLLTDKQRRAYVDVYIRELSYEEYAYRKPVEASGVEELVSNARDKIESESGFRPTKSHDGSVTMREV